MFTTDGTFDLTIDGLGQVGSFAGRAEIRKLYEDSLATQEDQRRHVVTNIFFEDETDDSVTAISYLVLITVKDGALNVISSGVYKDRVVLDDGTWRIAAPRPPSRPAVLTATETRRCTQRLLRTPA